MRRAPAAFVLLAALGLGASGCTLNAAFELELDLPAGPVGGPPVYVLIQPRSAAENPFPDEWRGDDLDSIELTDTPSSDHISILSGRDDIDLAVKARFCASPTCTDLDDDMAPERWFLFEHPFYIGARTSWNADPQIDAIPTTSDTTPFRVERCQIKGCVEGELSNYCRTDNRHLCE